MRAAFLVVLIVLGTAACWKTSLPGSEQDSDPGGDADTDSDTDGDADGDTESAADDAGSCEGAQNHYDSASGLCWQNPPVQSSILDWEDARDYCDQLFFGGYSDWRMPEIDELVSLLRGCVDGTATQDFSSSTCPVDDPGCLEETCDDVEECAYCGFLEGPADGCYWPAELTGWCDNCYWSSSSQADNDQIVWTVLFAYGAVSRTAKSNPATVRCVREAR
ncbi:MAG: DUF1566 domain-containing protein [Polyangia bacterium]